MLGSAYQDYSPGLGQGYKCLKLKHGGFAPIGVSGNGHLTQWMGCNGGTG
jgi:hypothetical protein